MIKQTLTFGGIIIAMLAVLTLAGVDLPAAGERLTAQLINSVKKAPGDIDPYDMREEIKGEVIKVPVREKGKDLPVKEVPVKEAPVKGELTVKDPYDNREDSLPVKLAVTKEVTTRPVKSTESSPSAAEVKKEEVSIPLLPTNEPKPIVENDYRISPSTSSETKEILEEVEALICFGDYIKPGASDNDEDEVERWQEFLNTYMKTDLEVSGEYDLATQEAVKAFQQKHYDYIIAPWTPPLQPRTTGYIYKTTRSMANYIIGCPESEIYLEDPGVWYSHLEQEITLQ